MSDLERPRPPIENRAERIVIVGQNMLSLFTVIEKWEKAYQRVLQYPTEQNQKHYKHIDKIFRTLMQILPELDEPID